MRLSAPLSELKRRAHRLARAERLPLHLALDRLAQAEGFARWSLLAARAAETAPRKATPVSNADDRRTPALASPRPPLDPPLLPRLSPGDRLLIAARPGQGKTLLALRLLLDAAREGRRAVFYTLEDTEAQTRTRLRALAGGDLTLAEAPEIVARDDIEAERIVADLGAGAVGAVAAVDYLQILDQRRSTPPLARQAAVLEDHARRSGATLAVLSQIDRSWSPTAGETPGLSHLRRPNPFPVEAFSHACFLHAGARRFESLA